MTNKTLAWIVLASCLVFSWSCVQYSWKKTPLQSIKPEKREQAKISAVQKKSGEKLTFVADKPPPPRFAYQELLMAAEAGSEYFS